MDVDDVMVDDKELAKVQAFVNGCSFAGNAAAVRFNSTTFQVVCENCKGIWKIGERKDGRTGQIYTAAKFISHLDDEGNCSRSTKMETVEIVALPREMSELRPYQVSENCVM